jgi:TonB family protein
MRAINHNAIILLAIVSVNPCIPAAGQEPKNAGAFISTEEMPTYGKGSTDLNLKKYLQQRLHYPVTAARDYIEGRTVVRFCISETGSVINPSVIIGVRSDLDNECIRALSGMTGWTPGRQDGKCVKVWYSIVVTFTLDGTAPVRGFIVVKPDAPGAEGAKVSVWPDPADDHIMVDAGSDRYPLDYRIYNLSGQAYVSGKIGSAEEPVDISGLGSGIYLIKVTVSGGIFVGSARFIKN